MEKNIYSLPMDRFEEIKNVLDDRFTRVKIYIAHTGENRNNVIFSKDVLEAMIPSLSYIPILGFLEADENGEVDFKAHEEKLVITDKGFMLDYKGHAYGMIPPDNNAHFEFRYGEDGVEREYLVCEGLLWRKFTTVEEIFNRDGGFKSQSLEIKPDSVEGYHNDFGQFVYTNGKFEGLCILGENVTPAMVNSTIERFSVSDNNITNEFSDMLKEFSYHFSKIEKGDEEVLDKEPVIEPVVEPVTEPVVEPVVTEPVTEFTEPQPTEPVVEPTVEPVIEPVVEPEPEPQPIEPVVTEPVVEPVTEFTADDKAPSDKMIRTFELSHDDIRSSIYSALDSHETFSSTWNWISKVYDNHAVIEQEDEGKLYKVNYVKHETGVSLGDFEEIFPMYVNNAEKQALEIARTNFSAMEEENKSLKQFKEKIELADKERKLSTYSTVLSKDEYETVSNNLSKFSMEEIEKEIGFMLLKKNHFSANNTENMDTINRVPATNGVTENPYGSLGSYFK